MSDQRLWKADLGDGTYQNPILWADYSDPDVIRVGDTYYMVASSFNYTPGLPILTSRDLVNWELKNYAVDNINYEQYQNPAHAKGIWAPAIRYHEGKYWIYYGMPDEGIFMIHTEDPLGRWSEPVLVLEGKGYIDTCPFWDEDGRAYVVHGYAKSRIGFNSVLGMFPMSWDGTHSIGDDKIIFDGTYTQTTIEGPKTYKRDGWYYIFAPAGHVKPGWQTVLRSKNIYGPYEEKIVLHQGNTNINGPHQGGLVDTPTGEEWFIHFQDRGFYGRITHLQPVKWVDGWPQIGINPDEQGCCEPCLIYKKPAGNPICDPVYLQASDDFKDGKLALQWQWLGNHDPSFYSLTERPGSLRLYSLNISHDTQVTLWNASNVLTQKLVCPAFEAEIKIDYTGLKDQEKTGFVIMGGQYAYLAVSRQAGNTELVYGESIGEKDTREEKLMVIRQLLKDTNSLLIRIVLKEEGGLATIGFSYSIDGITYIDSGFRYTPSDHTWVGAKLGLFSLAMDCGPDHGYVDFEYITVK